MTTTSIELFSMWSRLSPGLQVMVTEGERSGCEIKSPSESRPTVRVTSSSMHLAVCSTAQS